MKKGLNRKKNMISAKKKDLTATNIGPPTDLTIFLNSDATFDFILKAAEDDKQAIVVRRYVTILRSVSEGELVSLPPIYLREEPYGSLEHPIL